MITEYKKEYFSEWSKMRYDLWPDGSVEEHEQEMKAMLVGQTFDDEIGWKVYFILDNDILIGFVELSIRDQLTDLIDEPLGYIEGWYIKPAYRGMGYGRMLIEYAEIEFYKEGFRMMGSDVEFHNDISLKAHENMGYKVIAKNHESHILKKSMKES